MIDRGQTLVAVVRHDMCSSAGLLTHTASLQQQLTLAETVGAVGELHQGLLRLVPHGGVGGLVQLLTKDLQLGEALDEDTGLISTQTGRSTAAGPHGGLQPLTPNQFYPVQLHQSTVCSGLQVTLLS